MKRIKNFTIEEHTFSYENRPLKSKIYFDNKDINLEVSGYIIEKQFKLEKYFLLITSWDCSFEEAYEIFIISDNFKIVGKHSFCIAYNSYNLNDICEISKDCYKIIFNENLVYEVRVNYPKKNIFSNCVKVKELIY